MAFSPTRSPRSPRGGFDAVTVASPGGDPKKQFVVVPEATAARLLDPARAAFHALGVAQLVLALITAPACNPISNLLGLISGALLINNFSAESDIPLWAVTQEGTRRRLACCCRHTQVFTLGICIIVAALMEVAALALVFWQLTTVKPSLFIFNMMSESYPGFSETLLWRWLSVSLVAGAVSAVLHILLASVLIATFESFRDSTSDFVEQQRIAAQAAAIKTATQKNWKALSRAASGFSGGGAAGGNWATALRGIQRKESSASMGLRGAVATDPGMSAASSFASRLPPIREGSGELGSGAGSPRGGEGMGFGMDRGGGNMQRKATLADMVSALRRQSSTVVPVSGSGREMMAASRKLSLVDMRGAGGGGGDIGARKASLSDLVSALRRERAAASESSMGGGVEPYTPDRTLLSHSPRSHAPSSVDLRSLASPPGGGGGGYGSQGARASPRSGGGGMMMQPQPRVSPRGRPEWHGGSAEDSFNRVMQEGGYGEGGYGEGRHDGPLPGSVQGGYDDDGHGYPGNGGWAGRGQQQPLPPQEAPLSPPLPARDNYTPGRHATATQQQMAAQAKWAASGAPFVSEPRSAGSAGSSHGATHSYTGSSVTATSNPVAGGTPGGSSYRTKASAHTLTGATEGEPPVPMLAPVPEIRPGRRGGRGGAAGSGPSRQGGSSLASVAARSFMAPSRSGAGTGGAAARGRGGSGTAGRGGRGGAGFGGRLHPAASMPPGGAHEVVSSDSDDGSEEEGSVSVGPRGGAGSQVGGGGEGMMSSPWRRQASFHVGSAALQALDREAFEVARTSPRSPR